MVDNQLNRTYQLKRRATILGKTLNPNVAEERFYTPNDEVPQRTLDRLVGAGILAPHYGPIPKAKKGKKDEGDEEDDAEKDAPPAARNTKFPRNRIAPDENGGSQKFPDSDESMNDRRNLPRERTERATTTSDEEDAANESKKEPDSDQSKQQRDQHVHAGLRGLRGDAAAGEDAENESMKFPDSDESKPSPEATTPTASKAISVEDQSKATAEQRERSRPAGGSTTGTADAADGDDPGATTKEATSGTGGEKGRKDRESKRSKDAASTSTPSLDPL